MTDAAGPLVTSDGVPLKRSLAKSLRRQKLRALGLIAPLLLFVVITFIAPIADMLFRSVENGIVADTLPKTVVALRDWDESSGEAPDEPVLLRTCELLRLPLRSLQEEVVRIHDDDDVPSFIDIFM